MSPNRKLSVLAFVGAATAIPQYGHGHGYAHGSKHFTPSAGHAYPTGGWGSNGNNTAPVLPQGTGAGSKPADEKTTYAETDYTLTSTTTRTVYMTQYPSSAEPTEAAIKDVTSSAAPVCGQTVYVTEKDYVTVTVPAGGASASAPAPSSSAAPEAPSSAPAYEAPKPSAPAEKPSSAAPVASSSAAYEAPKPSTPAEKPSSAAPVAPSSSEAGYEVPSSSFVLGTTLVNKGQGKPTSAAAVSAPAPSAEAVYSSAAPASSVKEESSAPASTPSSAPSTGYSGGKRGLAYRWDGAADCKSFEGNNFGFVWNWEADTKGDIGSFAGNFIPTLRTLDNAGDWAEKAQAAIDAGSKVVFGFNEPDIASQANLGVSALCDAWKTHMNPFSGKATVVGPSVSSSEDKGQGLDYLGQFVEQCPEAKFDDINIHWYGPASAGFDAFKAHYEKAAGQFSGKKVWVSEFGLTGATAQESADFLKSAQAYLDGESSCAGYSYYAVGNFDPTANLLGTASALSEAGKIYVS